jgi:maltose-binding protein MalE
MHTSFKRLWLLLGIFAIAASALVFVTPALSAHKDSTLVIWTDQDRQAAVTQLANQWARRRASPSVVSKDFGSIQTNLGTVSADAAPDVVLAAHDWTGGLAANGLVEPLFPSAAVRAQFPKYTLDGFSYGTAVKKLYGIPVQVENIALIVDTALAPVPKTFAQVEATALKFKKNHSPSACASSRAPAVTRTTCTRSSPGSVATCSARTRPATSTRRTSAWRIRRSSRTPP